MTDIPLSDRIVVSREVMHGSPRIAGTRISVVQVLDLLAAGKTPSEIMSGVGYTKERNPRCAHPSCGGNTGRALGLQARSSGRRFPRRCAASRTAS